MVGRYFAFSIGITKLAGYSLCLSVIASVIPKSMNTALATIFAPIVLASEPKAFRPSSVSQSYFSWSSDRLMEADEGMWASHVPRLFWSLQRPLEPSLNEKATGTIASFVSVAHPTEATEIAQRISLFIFVLVVMRWAGRSANVDCRDLCRSATYDSSDA